MQVAPPENSRNIRVYVDQNIVGYIHEGAIDFSQMKGVDWIYSNEHFKEISRSKDISYLSVFEKLKAQRIEILLDDQFRIIDNAAIHPYESPYIAYGRYLETNNSVELDDALFNDLLGRFLGADNYLNLSSLPERFSHQLNALMMKAEILNETNQNKIEVASNKLQDFIKDNLNETRSLESMRIHFGTSKGAIGNLPAGDAIHEIWELINGKLGQVTIDQFFGFDPIDKQNYSEWPVYLGIVGCHLNLNIIGYSTDKGIAKVANLPKIMSDGAHIVTASFCDFLLSEDVRLCKKAAAIYKYRKLCARVIHLEVIKPK